MLQAYVFRATMAKYIWTRHLTTMTAQDACASLNIHPQAL